jgi:TetR/AcrR family transcriptional repressor of bet genes
VTEVLNKASARRREELRQAAYEMAGKHGFGALTVAGIAEQAGITKGNIHHYFDSKEDLIEHAVRFAHAEFRKAVVERLRKARSPSERLWSVIDGNFSPEIFQLGYRRLWISIYQAAKINSRLARLCEILDRRYIMHVMMPLRELVPPAELDTRAFAIMALVDGCWLLAVSEPNVTRHAALGIIADYIRANIPAFDMAVVKLSDP